MFGFKREKPPVVQICSAERAYELTHSDPVIQELVGRYHMLQVGGSVMNDRSLLDETERALLEQLAVHGIELERTESAAGFDDTVGAFMRQFDTPEAI